MLVTQREVSFLPNCLRLVGKIDHFIAKIFAHKVDLFTYRPISLFLKIMFLVLLNRLRLEMRP